MLANGDQHLSRHVTALLGTRRLVLNVNTRGPLLHEKLRQFHHSGKATMAGVSIGNDGSKVVDIGHFGTVRNRRGKTFLSLLAVVKKLSHPKMTDFVRHGRLGRVSVLKRGRFEGLPYVRIIRQIRTRLV